MVELRGRLLHVVELRGRLLRVVELMGDYDPVCHSLDLVSS